MLEKSSKLKTYATGLLQLKILDDLKRSTYSSSEKVKNFEKIMDIYNQIEKDKFRIADMDINVERKKMYNHLRISEEENKFKNLLIAYFKLFSLKDPQYKILQEYSNNFEKNKDVAMKYMDDQYKQMNKK